MFPKSVHLAPAALLEICIAEKHGKKVPVLTKACTRPRTRETLGTRLGCSQYWSTFFGPISKRKVNSSRSAQLLQ